MALKLDILARFHRQMMDIVLTGRPLIALSYADADLVGLSYLRVEMVERLAAYQRYVHTAVFEDAHLSSDAPEREHALAMKVRCIQLERDYQSFARRWSQRDVAGNWPEYRLSALRMIKQMTEHFTAELALAA